MNFYQNEDVHVDVLVSCSTFIGILSKAKGLSAAKYVTY